MRADSDVRQAQLLRWIETVLDHAIYHINRNRHLQEVPTDFTIGEEERWVQWSSCESQNFERLTIAKLDYERFLDSLCERERQVCSMLSLDLPQRVIAQRLRLSDRSIRRILRRIRRKARGASLHS